ncbi:MAG: DUF2071 domain-containing protein [Candidatus Sumerlaeaceae bacterium]
MVGIARVIRFRCTKELNSRTEADKVPQEKPQDIAATIEHRPYPLQSEPWVMFQSWHDLLFAHWPVDSAQLKQQVPSCLTLDELRRQCMGGGGTLSYDRCAAARHAFPALVFELSRAECAHLCHR